MDVDHIIEKADQYWPFLIEFRNTKYQKLFDLRNVLKPGNRIYYVNSMLSKDDKEQRSFVVDNPAIHTIGFKSDVHGKPFLTILYDWFINLSPKRLEFLTKSSHNPRVFVLANIFKPTCFVAVLPKVMHKLYKKYLRHK